MRPVSAIPPRGQTWATLLKNHARDTWACDFLPVVDLLFRPMFLFFIIELGSRRVVHFGVTRHPTEVWAAQQLREATPYGEGPRYLIRDNDAKFGTRFDDVADKTGIEVLRIPFRAPRANAICERFLGSVRRECLDHLIIFGQRQLYHVMKEYVEYFNRARPHQGIDQKVPAGNPTEKGDLTRGNIIPFPGMPASREDRVGQHREWYDLPQSHLTYHSSWSLGNLLPKLSFVGVYCAGRCQPQWLSAKFDDQNWNRPDLPAE
jgi:putative transposase